MNGNRQVEVHYIDNGFPYTVTQNFMDLFEGLSYAQADVALAEALQDQGNSYWSMMHTSSYKYGFFLSASNPYYGFSHAYEINDYTPRLDGGRRVLENPAPSNIVDLPQPILLGLGISDANTSPNTEDCIRANPNTSSPQGHDRRCNTGFFVFVGSNLVSWKSKKQNVVPRSSAESKYRVMAKTTCELAWIR